MTIIHALEPVSVGGTPRSASFTSRFGCKGGLTLGQLLGSPSYRLPEISNPKRKSASKRKNAIFWPRIFLLHK